jgi:hypothetical protein
LIGAAAGNAGKGAAIGAASGGALGIIGNADGAPFAQESLQQQYDIMYGQCMAAQGNSVASFSRPGITPDSGSASPYSGDSPPYLSGPSSYPSPYSGDLPPYYGGPPPPAPGGAPYPGAPVRRRATEPVASLERRGRRGKSPVSCSYRWSTDFLMSVRKELLQVASVRHLPAPTGVLDRSRVSQSE